MSTVKRNFYEILNTTSSASFNELKSNYKQLILQFHPDKLQQQLEPEPNNPQTKDDPNNLEFVAITEAWNCLKDPVKRKQYDAEQLLNKFHTHNNIYAHIKLMEMKKQLNTGEYFKDDDDEEREVDKVNNSKGEGAEQEEEEVSKYIYTYDCRCGGQYIVDESAEQYCRPANNRDTQIINSDNNGVHDDADNKIISGSSSSVQNNQNSPNNLKNTNNDGSSKNNSTKRSGAGGSEGVVQNNLHDDDVDEEGSDELIVECSECSLVIILNG